MAVLAQGELLALEVSAARPLFVDPPAFVGYIRGSVSAVGAVSGFSLSGEERQVDFTGKGTVLVQSSARDTVIEDANAPGKPGQRRPGAAR